MAYALEASKRKFERILESFSVELGSKCEKPSKKPRLADVSLNKRPITKFLHLRPAKPQDTTIAKDPSTVFNPFNKRELGRRLLTFRSDVSAWRPKSEDISELKWALRGWELMEEEVVGCKRCQQRIRIDLKAQDVDLEETDMEKEERRTETEASLVSHYMSQIVDGHDEDCPWRKRGCDASLYSVHFGSFNDTVKRLRDRFESLKTVKLALPREVETGRKMDTQKLFQSFIDRVYADRGDLASANTEGGDTAEVPQYNNANSTAFTLALVGWARDTNSKDAKDVVIHCGACFARVGLWMYEHDTESGEALSGGGLLPTLDAAETHYFDCPWVNSATQQPSSPSTTLKSSRMLPAWETLVSFLDSTTKTSPTPMAQNLDASTASSNRAARDIADKARLKKARELTQSFSFKKSKASA